MRAGQPLWMAADGSEEMRCLFIYYRVTCNIEIIWMGRTGGAKYYRSLKIEEEQQVKVLQAAGIMSFVIFLCFGLQAIVKYSK